jgi:hypothetical protein
MRYDHFVSSAPLRKLFSSLIVHQTVFKHQKGRRMITAQDDNSALREDGFEQTAALLDLLLWNGPSTMIPTREAVSAWRAVLVNRGVAFASLVVECDEWLFPAEEKKV